MRNKKCIEPLNVRVFKFWYRDQKLSKLTEGLPKKSNSTSSIDFRRYLYEAPIFSMPVSRGYSNPPQIKPFLVIGLVLGGLNFGFHVKNCDTFQ
jgi:hypothetical protein